MAMPARNVLQEAAIQFGDGPLRIIAGAGTGKTRTLVERALWLIEARGVQPSQILLLTFTVKAAQELRERLAERMGSPVNASSQVDVDTYNAFGARIVREFGSLYGLPPEPLVLSEAESWILLWRSADDADFQHIELASINDPRSRSNPLRRILALSRRLGDELRTVADLQAYASSVGPADPSLADHARGVAAYAAAKERAGAIDLNDQIVLACQLLEDANVAAQVRARYRYVLVDEFQDTNYAQSVMLQRLVGDPRGNITVVGDPNQAIYGFRGAAPDTLERLAAEVFPGMETKPLTLNYRSTQAILDVANALWTSAPDIDALQLQAADQSPGPRPIVAEAETRDDELAGLAAQILRYHDEGFRFADMAILVRSHALKAKVGEALHRAGIPAQLVGGGSLYQAREVRELLGHLRALIDHGDDAAFAAALTGDRWGLSERGLVELARARERGESLQATARRLVASGGASPPVTGCIEMLDRLSQRSYAGIEAVLELLLEMRAGGYDRTEQVNVDRFAAKVRRLAENRLDVRHLPELVRYLDLMIRAGDDEAGADDDDIRDVDAVTAMTMHGAKGLQWPIVFLPCFTQSDAFSTRKDGGPILPDALARPSPGKPMPSQYAGGDADPQYRKDLDAWRADQIRREAMRLLYVALTRAEHRLWISWSRLPTYYKQERRIVEAFAPCLAHCDVVQLPAMTPLEAQRATIGAVLQPVAAGLSQAFAAGGADAEARIRALLTVPWLDAGGDPAAMEGGLAIAADLARTIEHRRVSLASDGAPTLAEVSEVSPLRLSATAIETFEACPHRYYLDYVRRLPGAPSAGATTYGAAVHEALARVGMDQRLGRRIDWQELAARVHGDDGGGVGSDEREGLGRDPIAVFAKLPDAAAEPLLIEAPFTLRVGDLRVAGVIDRVHRLPDGTLEVVDYKTDRRLRSVDEVRSGWQLPIYLLACREVFRDLDPAPQRAAMVFLRHGVRREVTFSAEDLRAVRYRLTAIASAIATVAPDDHRASPETCRWCRHRAICRFSHAR